MYRKTWQHPLRIRSWSALAATVLALVYAAISAYWAVGGMIGLRSVGYTVVRVARDHSTQAEAIIWVTVCVKVMCAVLSYLLAIGISHRAVKSLNTIIAIALTLYGGVLVAVALLVETGLVRPDAAVDWYALKWHLLVWDLWFLIWGLLLFNALNKVHKAYPAKAL